MNKYYQNTEAGTVHAPGGKSYRISVRNGVPYITYQRKTRVLFKGPLSFGAKINVNGQEIHFRDTFFRTRSCDD